MVRTWYALHNGYQGIEYGPAVCCGQRHTSGRRISPPQGGTEARRGPPSSDVGSTVEEYKTQCVRTRGSRGIPQSTKRWWATITTANWAGMTPDIIRPVSSRDLY